MFHVLTDNPVATSSPDHTHPCGTKNDNSRNRRFNEKLYGLFSDRKIAVLDLGCSGGGFVKDCLDDGHAAVGIEGSDYSKLRRRAEWATIPDNLFTADATKTFVVLELSCLDDTTGLYRLSKPASFDVITAWEFMEHIREEDLPGLVDNVNWHLRTGGLWVMSVSPLEALWHQCAHDKPWWDAKFAALCPNFKRRDDLVAHFGNDWIRGPLQGADGSFHYALEKVS